MVVQIFETEIGYFLFDLKISTTLNKIKYINSFRFFCVIKKSFHRETFSYEFLIKSNNKCLNNKNFDCYLLIFD